MKLLTSNHFTYHAMNRYGLLYYGIMEDREKLHNKLSAIVRLNASNDRKDIHT